MIINPASQPPKVEHSAGQADNDLAETLIETPRGAGGAGGQPPPMQPKPPVQAVAPQPGSPPEAGTPGPPGDDDDIMEQTIIIRSDVKKE